MILILILTMIETETNSNDYYYNSHTTQLRTVEGSQPAPGAERPAR